MCGRFVQATDPYVLAEILGAVADSTHDRFSPRFNIAPSTNVIVMRDDDHRRALTTMSWGFVPKWTQQKSLSQRLANARSETAWEKPSFRHAMRSGRCILPIDGFYEWAPATHDGPRSASGKPAKRPHYFRRADGAPLLVAAMCELERGDGRLPPGGSAVCLLTTGPNDTMRPIHDRMPVILEPSDVDAWLTCEPDDARELLDALLRPAGPSVLNEHEVSIDVNNARNEGAHLTEVTVGPEGTLF